MPGKIKDVILDPHLQRGISRAQDCHLCKVNYGSEPIAQEKLLELEHDTPS